VADIKLKNINKVFICTTTATVMANTHATATDYDYPALCIPRSTEPITVQEIYNTFNKSGLGVVSKVVVKPKTFRLNPWEEITDRDRDRDPQNVVSYDNIYVYFKKWNTHNPAIKTYRDRLLNGQTIKIVFKSIPTPVFWRCVAARFKSQV
jgi:hypothetical protein